MAHQHSTTTVISLGGSLVVPGDIDTSFVTDILSLIREYVAQGHSFVIITGGGHTARMHQQAARAIGQKDARQLDWIGIHATHFNARFMHALMAHDDVHPDIVTSPEDMVGVTAPIVFGAGSEPGHSTDMGAVELAHACGAHEVVNLSGARYVYDVDPKTHPDARAYDTLSWDEYCELVPREWTPGLNTPFDPIAARRAQDYHMRVVIAGGDVENLRTYLETGDIDGTIIV